MKQNRIIQPILLAVVLAIGFGVTATFIIAIGMRFTMVVIRPVGPEYESSGFLKDGTPVIHTHRSGRTGSSTRLLNGKTPVTVEKDSSPSEVHLYKSMLPPESRSWSYRVKYLHRDNTFVNWYLVRDADCSGTVYFVCYDSETKMPVGFLGRKGFSEQPPPEQERFHASLQDPVRYHAYKMLLLADDQLYEIDFDSRKIRVLANIEDPLAFQVSRQDDWSEKESEIPLLTVLNEQQVIFFNVENKKEVRYTLPPELQKASIFSLCLAKFTEGTLIANIGSHSSKTRFIWFDKSGKILKRKTAALKRRSSSRWETAMETAASLVTSGTVTLPLVYLLAISEGGDWEKVSGIAIRKRIAKKWPMLIAVYILSLLLAVLCYRRQRKYAQAWTWVWVLFVFFGGLPAMVGYLCHRRWPPRVECITCGAISPQDRDACPNCDARYPTPEMTGAEVFA